MNFTYESASLVSASSSPCFDTDIQYSSRRCVAGKELIKCKSMATNDIFGSCEAKRSLCARNWTLWHYFSTFILTHCTSTMFQFNTFLFMFVLIKSSSSAQGVLSNINMHLSAITDYLDSFGKLIATYFDLGHSKCIPNAALHLYLQYIYSFSRCFYPNWLLIEEIINTQPSCIAQEKRTPWFLTARSGMTQWPSSGRRWRLWTIHAVGLEFVPVMELFTHLVSKFSLGTDSLLRSSGFCSVALWHHVIC